MVTGRPSIARQRHRLREHFGLSSGCKSGGHLVSGADVAEAAKQLCGSESPGES